MEYEVPEYSKPYGRVHVSASGGTQPIYEHILKMYLRKEYQMNFPFAARPKAGQVVQMVADLHLGLHEYSPIFGQTDGIPIAEAITKGRTEFMQYQPKDWDDGKDAEEKAEFIEHVEAMSLNAIAGVKEFFGDSPIEGEYQRFYWDERIDVPVTLFLDYADEEKQIDLKCSLPVRNPPKKDGTRTWRVPKPKTEPTEQQVMQQAVYWKATGLRPALLFVTSDGYNIATEDNCPALKPEALEDAYNTIVGRWLAVQNLMKAAMGNWKTLFGMVVPDYGQIGARHGREILDIAKQAWRV